MSSDNSFSWSVELPTINNAALGQKRPRARLLIGESEVITIPKAVGTRLKRLEKEGRSFGSRAELLHTLKEVSQTCAHDRMEQLVNYREYSSAELKQKLTDDGYLPKLADEIVARAKVVGIISDTRFAESFIRTKLNSGWGKTRICRELERRGIPPETIESLEELFPTPEVELERAYDLVSRRRLTGNNDFQKIVRRLVNRGFSLTVSKAVAKRILEESIDES